MVAEGEELGSNVLRFGKGCKSSFSVRGGERNWDPTYLRLAPGEGSSWDCIRMMVASAPLSGFHSRCDYNAACLFKLPRIGSDHLPVCITLQLDRQAHRPTQPENRGSERTVKPASTILREMGEWEADRIALGEIIDKAGSRTHGFALFIFALPEAVPIPVPGISAFLAIPLVLISAHLAAFGERAPIPERLRRRTLPVSLVRKVNSYVLPVLERLEKLVKPRLQGIAERERFLGACCLALSLLIVAPIPFANLVPAVFLAMIALGMVQRDGMLAVLGIALATGSAATVYFAASSIKTILGG
jgi:hypothetical protein